MNELILDSVGVGSDILAGLGREDFLAEALDFDSFIDLGQSLVVLVADGVGVDPLLDIDGELWQCWVLSTSGFYPSVYSGYNFNSFAHFNGVDYAADEHGIYELGGTDDDGETFTSGILFHSTAFRNTSRRKFRKVFVNAEGAGMRFEAKTDTGSRVFSVQRSRVPVTRDLRGMKWRFAIEDFDSFDFFEAFQTVLSR